MPDPALPPGVELAVQDNDIFAALSIPIDPRVVEAALHILHKVVENGGSPAALSSREQNVLPEVLLTCCREALRELLATDPEDPIYARDLVDVATVTATMFYRIGLDKWSSPINTLYKKILRVEAQGVKTPGAREELMLLGRDLLFNLHRFSKAVAEERDRALTPLPPARGPRIKGWDEQTEVTYQNQANGPVILKVSCAECGEQTAGVCTCPLCMFKGCAPCYNKHSVRHYPDSSKRTFYPHPGPGWKG